MFDDFDKLFKWTFAAGIVATLVALAVIVALAVLLFIVLL